MGKRRNDITNEQIFNLYFDEDLSCSKVAKILNCDRTTVIRRIEEEMFLNRKIMSRSEHMTKAFKVSKPLLDFDIIYRIEGELLGDGNITSVVKQAYYRHSTAKNKEEYLDWLISIFNINGIETKKYFYKSKNKNNREEYCFNTQSTTELMNMFNKWYVKNERYNPTLPNVFKNRKFIKCPPYDLVLNKISILHWFIGDGTIKSGKSGINLATHGFGYDAVEYLRYRLLNDLDIPTIHTKENSIYILKCNSKKLLNIIGNSPVKCYEYKWDLNYVYQSKKTQEIDMRIVLKYIDKNKNHQDNLNKKSWI